MKPTWDYYRDDIDGDQEPTDEQVWQRLRAKVREDLTSSDFRVLPDVPWITDSWYAYRQSLRDLDNVTEDPREAEWPEQPPVEYPLPPEPEVPEEDQEVLPFEE